MAGQAAEQIIAGVVLSERLAVTMYGAIHRAQFNGQRNLRGLVVDPRMLEDDGFRLALTDAKTLDKLTTLQHPNIVPVHTVESGGPDVVIVTRGVGRYVTVQDLIESSKARSRLGGKLSTPVAAAIGKAVIEALAAAHRAGVVHGAVHPRSVLIGEDGVVMLGDFIVGRALTTAVSQGADSSLWRGLTGYIAPELYVPGRGKSGPLQLGQATTPGVDVYAVGAMMFAMLTGDVPPGSLRVTPAVERLVQRSLDADPARRYKTASDMLENLLEAIEDDRWEPAERGELIKEAGLSASDENIDDATEDLLASLGKSAVQVTKPAKDPEPIGAKHKAPNTTQNRRLDALINDLGGDDTGLTHVDDEPAGARRDPISDIIHSDGRRFGSNSRVPSLDDPDDDDATPLPPPSRGTTHADEMAALDAIDDLDEAARRSSAKLEAKREATPRPAAPRPVAKPIVDPIQDLDVPMPKLRSPLKSAISGLVLFGVIGGAGFLVYSKMQEDKAKQEQAKLDREKQLKEKDEIEKQLRDAQVDSGALDITSSGAGIWLRLGRTPLDTTIKLTATQQHDLVLLKAGHEVANAQINGTHWSGAKESLKGKIDVALKPSKAKDAPVLPPQPPTAVLGSTGVVGTGYVHIESTPGDAEVWLFIGANQARFNEVIAGRDYDVAVVRPGFKTQLVSFKADEWRDGDPTSPIDVAKKKPMLSRTVELEKDPTYKPPKKGK